MSRGETDTVVADLVRRGRLRASTVEAWARRFLRFMRKNAVSALWSLTDAEASTRKSIAEYGAVALSLVRAFANPVLLYPDDLVERAAFYGLALDGHTPPLPVVHVPQGRLGAAWILHPASAS